VIAKPMALAVMERRLYYLDPKFEQVVRVDLPNGENAKVLLSNEPDLRTLNIYRNRAPAINSLDEVY
jgi:low density lipoprotein-related protein 2